MRNFSDQITLVKNSRGVWDLDTSKGCTSGIRHNPKGCYGDCYAARNSHRNGYDFNKTVLRHFKDEAHEYSIVKQINKIDMPFVRIGVSGDPSENWEHALNVCEKISSCTKPVVIITKHWNNLTDVQLERLSKLDVYINTSVSALDSPDLLYNRLVQYNKLKGYCKSILRIVSCNFNLQNEEGRRLSLVQDELFHNDNVLDTVLRVSPKNEYVLNGIINTEMVKFMDKLCLASVLNKNTFLGKCYECPEMCGLNLFR